jgi:hypothetical protein
MHRQKTKPWFRVNLAILAGCLAGVVAGQAAQNPSQPVGGSGVPAKHSKLKKNANSKNRKSKVAGAKQKKPVVTKRQAKNQSQDDSAKEMVQLKQQLALQQEQIAQLLQAVNQLQSQIAANPKVVAPARATQPSGTPRTAAASRQPSSDNEIASLTPILPPQVGAQSEEPNQILAVNTPMNLPQSKEVAATAAGTQETARPAVTGSEGLPAGQGKKSAPLDFDNGKVKLGATFYGFYRYFPKTGFGPQTLDNTDIHPGPGNDGFNEFNINRTYINFFYSPTDALTFRVTPNVYREVGGASAESLSSTSGTGASVNGNLSFRLKYAYMDFNTPFARSKAFGKDKLTFGQQQQPLTDWEEGLYGYRFVNLTPWNYWSLSSTFTGVKLHGPIMLAGKQYLDYEIGVFNDASFHAYEVGEKKQVMARLSYYPMGAASKYQGLGLTGFVDYGYKDAAPDQNVNFPETRFAALVHYETKSGDYGIAGEYDYGRNAFSEGNLFSGSGPADFYGLGTTQYATFNSLAAALLAGSHTNQRGIDFFGHARLGKSPFYLFGMFEQLNPNTNVSNDPLDFRTVIGGISYKYGKYWQFAVDSQNIIYYQSQTTFPASELALFSPSLAASNPGGITNAVPTNTNAIFFNVLFNY